MTGASVQAPFTVSPTRPPSRTTWRRSDSLSPAFSSPRHTACARTGGGHTGTLSHCTSTRAQEVCLEEVGCPWAGPTLSDEGRGQTKPLGRHFSARERGGQTGTDVTATATSFAQSGPIPTDSRQRGTATFSYEPCAFYKWSSKRVSCPSLDRSLIASRSGTRHCLAHQAGGGVSLSGNSAGDQRCRFQYAKATSVAPKPFSSPTQTSRENICEMVLVLP